MRYDADDDDDDDFEAAATVFVERGQNPGFAVYTYVMYIHVDIIQL